jgi:hypothetical protein
MDATETPGDFRASLQAFTNLLEKAIEFTNEENLDKESLYSLECTKRVLRYLRAGGLEDHLVVTGDLDVALGDYGFDYHFDQFAWPLSRPTEITLQDEAWRAARDAYVALDDPVTRVEAKREKQGLRKLWAKHGIIVAARVGSTTSGPSMGGSRASVAIIESGKNPYTGAPNYLPTTDFGDGSAVTSNAKTFASVLSETFPDSGRGGCQASLVDSLCLLRHCLAQPNCNSEVSGPSDTGFVNVAHEEPAGCASAVPLDTGSYVGVLIEDAELDGGDSPEERKLHKGSVVLVHTGGEYQATTLAAVQHPETPHMYREKRKKFCESLASSLDDTGSSGRLTAQETIKCIDAVLDSLASTGPFRGSEL